MEQNTWGNLCIFYTCLKLFVIIIFSLSVSLPSFFPTFLLSSFLFTCLPAYLLVCLSFWLIAAMDMFSIKLVKNSNSTIENNSLALSNSQTFTSLWPRHTHWSNTCMRARWCPRMHTAALSVNSLTVHLQENGWATIAIRPQRTVILQWNGWTTAKCSHMGESWKQLWK